MVTTKPPQSAKRARMPATIRVAQVLLAPLAFFTTVGGIIFNLVPGAPGTVPLGIALLIAGLAYATSMVLLYRSPHRGWLIANAVLAVHFLWGLVQKIVIEREQEALVFAAVQLVLLVLLNLPASRRYVESHR